VKGFGKREKESERVINVGIHIHRLLGYMREEAARDKWPFVFPAFVASKGVP
jgi:hypothetical protein